MLPAPLRLRLPAGGTGEIQACTWWSPWRLPLPAGRGFDGTELPAVRLSSYTCARRDNADFRREARRLRVTLPPILLHDVWALPLHTATTAARQDRQLLEAKLHQVHSRYWEAQITSQAQAGETTAEYAPGSVIGDDQDGTFESRFLYTFWRMCELSKMPYEGDLPGVSRSSIYDMRA